MNQSAIKNFVILTRKRLISCRGRGLASGKLLCYSEQIKTEPISGQEAKKQE